MEKCLDEKTDCENKWVEIEWQMDKCKEYNERSIGINVKSNLKFPIESIRLIFAIGSIAKVVVNLW